MNRSNDENRQCLDYLGGDNDDNSPSKICESLGDIETKLKSLRLRHCCERDVASALHNEAYEQVLKKDKEFCKMRLNELIEVDKLAERITCEFREILVRYDCGHKYSLIHDCDDCKVSNILSVKIQLFYFVIFYSTYEFPFEFLNNNFSSFFPALFLKVSINSSSRFDHSHDDISPAFLYAFS